MQDALEAYDLWKSHIMEAITNMSDSKTTIIQRISMVVWLPMIVLFSIIVWSSRGMAAIVDSFWQRMFTDA